MSPVTRRDLIKQGGVVGAGLALGGVALPSAAQGVEIVPIQGPWPTLFELDPGGSAQLQTSSGTTTVELIDVVHRMEPDYYTGQAPGNRIHAAATVRVKVNGSPVTLLCRPAQLPVTVGGVRLYVETTYEWAHSPGQRSPLPDVTRAVRFSAVAAGATWGPSDVVFPIADYRWRSGTYQNTWLSLVPFNNNYYYHRGEDLGAIPDRLPVVAVRDAVVISAPIPGQPADSNPVFLDIGSGAVLRYSHMNIDSIRPDIVPGKALARGEAFAKTGQTFNGLPTQFAPHLHVDLRLDDVRASPYPTYIESYFRTYNDKVLAIAGGFGFTLANQDYVLDATRSVARPGQQITSYEWRLHTGVIVNGPTATLRFATPGLYSEELIVRTATGDEDRDFITVRVYAPTVNKTIANGWAYYSPARNIVPGTPVLFWNKLRQVSNAKINFGDGSPQVSIGTQTTHAYAAAGLYRVTISGSGPNGEPATVRMRVRVNPGGGETVLFSDNFSDGNAVGWTAQLGSWSVVSDGTQGPVYRQASSGTSGYSTAGQTTWANYAVEAKVKSNEFPAGSAAGIMGRFKDADNYYWLRLKQTGNVQFYRQVNGVITLLKQAPITVQSNQWYTLKLTFNGTSITGYVDGVQHISINDGLVPNGKIGVRSYQQSFSVDDVVVTAVS